MKFCAAAVSLVVLVNAGQSQDLVIRTETRLVEVSVTATDGKGKAVTGLTREDFSISDEGKPQKIADFAIFGPHGASPASGVHSNRGLGGSLTVILLDSMNVPFGNQSFARDQLLRWLKSSPSLDRTAILALDTKVQLLHDFTSDHDALIAAVEHYTPKSNPRFQSLPAAPSNDPTAASGPDPFEIVARQWADYANPVRLRGTIEAIQQIAKVLDRFKERKNLIWISGDIPIYVPGAAISDQFKAFEQESRQAMQVLSNAGIAVYPVNPQGLSSLGTANDARMDALARDTGGRAFYTSNDLRSVFQAVLDDSRSGYTLTYYPTAETWDGKFRTIKVTAGRPGVQLHYRDGYLAVPGAATTSDEIPLEKAPLNTVVASGLEFTGIGLDARVEQKAGSVRVSVTINADDLALSQQNGVRLGSADFLIAVGNAESKSFEGSPDHLNIKLNSEAWAKVQQEGGVMIVKNVAIPKGSDQMRIVVRDSTTGMAGALIFPLHAE